ncbi:MAG: hypothetical protein A3E83_00670 [Gammaproteobacteria bacterium RIFCSPHIGHO2_12_FULL_41_20]|nr:MAG: hypothetical protein A3E83_00670 [Gammaproteobacteria bacterium RIFCSPHIGHO2_12_FULL_41_20]
MYIRHRLFTLSAISFICVSPTFAAKSVDLTHQPVSILQSLSSTKQMDVKETSRATDFNKTTHIRIQQTYAGYPVWGSDAIIHVPHNTHASLTNLSTGTTMNGTMYQNLAVDLNNTPPAEILTTEQANKAVQFAVQLYQKKTGIKTHDLSKVKKNIIVYVDNEYKAHWAYLVTFLTGTADGMPALPTYILDANSFTIYEEWNDVQTTNKELSQGGGFGGNPKMGKLIYDGLTDNRPSLAIKRDVAKNTCYLENNDVESKDARHQLGPFGSAPVAKFQCNNTDSQHNNVYWSGDVDAVNGGYSPANDALYIGQVIKDMYQVWYGLPVLSQYGKPLKLKLNVHVSDFFGQPMDNAMFLPLTNEMYFGDGASMFYPLTSLGVGAHEISHGFTSQHSNLAYQKQSGGLNESFSDMAAQAAEFYAYGTNNWQIGPEIVKGNGALRYMDDPTKDGKSIGHVRNYNDSLNVHYSSGVFNKVFYLLATASNWNTKKAFDVMVQANMHYWTANATFQSAACGVMKAAYDYHYDLGEASKAFNVVGIDTTVC